MKTAKSQPSVGRVSAESRQSIGRLAVAIRMLPADMSRSPLDQLSTFVERVSIAGNDRHSTAGAFNTHDPNYFGF